MSNKVSKAMRKMYCFLKKYNINQLIPFNIVIKHNSPVLKNGPKLTLNFTVAKNRVWIFQCAFKIFLSLLDNTKISNRIKNLFPSLC